MHHLCDEFSYGVGTSSLEVWIDVTERRAQFLDEMTHQED